MPVPTPAPVPHLLPDRATLLGRIEAIVATLARAVLAAALLPGSAGAADALLAGKELLLERERLRVASRDAAIDLGGGPSSPDDPSLHGGTLRVLSVEGDVFDATYALPADGWRLTTRRGVARGWRFEGDGPVRSVRLESGRKLVVKAKGSLGHTLGANPAPVRVVLRLGERSYCLEFGGEAKLEPGVRYRATSAPAPSVCPLPYGEDAAWLCRPDRPGDLCLTGPLEATVIEPDLETRLEPHVPAGDPPFDCFHVYPTVVPNADGTPSVGNQLDVTHPQYVSRATAGVLRQAARFSRACRVFVPHYRQVTLLGLFAPGREALLQLAYRDVLDAWRLYLKHWNGGRPVVVMGHSQGTEMAMRLLRDEVDPSPALRAQLVAAILLGGGITVAEGELAGGSFQNLPLCASAEETGCVLAFRSYAATHPPANGSNDIGGEGEDAACTNPAAPASAGALASFAGSYLPADPYFPDATTPFVKLEHFWSGQCAKDAASSSFLAVSASADPGDLRVDPVPYDDIIYSPAIVGTHILDFDWGLGDLIDLVDLKAAALLAGAAAPAPASRR